MNKNEGIALAAEELGGQTELAKGLGIAPAYLWQLMHGKRQVSETIAIKIEELTAGKVRAEKVRPDVPWHVLRSKAA